MNIEVYNKDCVSFSGHSECKHIFISGMPGSGKTTLGRCIAEKLCVPFYDSDLLIEEQEGLSISQIFKTRGEKYFRAMEHKILELVSERESHILASGGGMPAISENARIVKERYINFFLYTSMRNLESRLKSGTERPLLQRVTRMDIDTLWNERKEMYLSTADVLVCNDYAHAGEIFPCLTDEISKIVCRT